MSKIFNKKIFKKINLDNYKQLDRILSPYEKALLLSEYLMNNKRSHVGRVEFLTLLNYVFHKPDQDNVSLIEECYKWVAKENKPNSNYLLNKGKRD